MKETTLAEIADDFDLFLLDQFGVLLDASGAYPDAPAAVAELGTRGKRIGIISNSGKRSGPNKERLGKRGFDTAHIAAVISSGEATHGVLEDRIGRDLPKGAKVLVLSSDGDPSGIEGLDLMPTDNPEEADLVLIAGSQGETVTLAGYSRQLEGPAARGAPAICSNPDMTMLTDDGTTFGAGRIAALYRELGGQVDEIGKPHALIYRFAADRLGVDDPNRVLCIGDSPAHDVRGGKGAGFKTALVRTGIHADEPLADLLARVPDSDEPDFIIPSFAF